jgi:hypothetical protein
VRRTAARLATVVALLLGFTVFTRAAGAEAEDGTVSGPRITVDDSDVASGDLVWVTLDGFQSGSVTVAVCGNEARRGSGDCNMIRSKGIRLMMNPTVSRFVISEPSTDCPCILRAASPDNTEIAVVPITLRDHPVSPVVGGPDLNGPFVAVSISAHTKQAGLFAGIRPSLGGPLTYEVTVTVKNLMPEALHQVRLTGSVGRNADDNLSELALGDPGIIDVGQTWSRTVPVVVPAPSFGGVEWRVTASGAGPTVSATTHTRHRPLLLMVVLMLLIIDIGLLLMRLAIRRRIARAERADALRGEPGEPLDSRADEELVAAM